MALSPATAWTAAFERSDVKPRVLLTITYAGPTSVQATSGYCSQIDVPPSVLSTSSISVELDPLTREVQTSGLDITVEDAWIRPILTANRLLHQQVTVELGSEDLAEANFLSYFSGIIESIEAEPNKQGVTLRCVDAFGFLKLREVVGYWYNSHPLQIIEDILVGAGIPSGLYDATTLDPSDSSYSAISHFCVSRALPSRPVGRVSPGMATHTKAWDLVQELCELINGQFVVNEAGKLSFKLFDNSTATDFAWTADDIISSRAKEIHSRVINRFEVEFNRFNASAVTQQGGTQIHQENDTDSQSNYAYPGESELILSESMTTPWLDQNLSLLDTITDSDTTINIGGTLHGMCGTSWRKAASNHGTPTPSGDFNAKTASQETWADLGASNKIYLLIEDEIITATGISALSGLTLATDRAVYRVHDPNDTDPNTVDYLDMIGHLALTGCARGQLGTTATAHNGADSGANRALPVWDITIPYHAAKDRIDRFGDGLHVLEVETQLWTYPAQIGDVGTVVDDTFLAFGYDGTDTGDKWEIIGKELDIVSMRMRFTLASATTNSNTKTYYGRVARILTDDILARSFDRADRAAYRLATEGFPVSDSGLDITIGSGATQAGDYVREIADSVTHTVPASKDTYFDMDADTGALLVRSVTTAAAAPTLDNKSTRLGMVVAGASSISSTKTLELRDRGSFSKAALNNENDRNVGNLIINGSFSSFTRG